MLAARGVKSIFTCISNQGDNGYASTATAREKLMTLDCNAILTMMPQETSLDVFADAALRVTARRTTYEYDRFLLPTRTLDAFSLTL